MKLEKVDLLISINALLLLIGLSLFNDHNKAFDKIVKQDTKQTCSSY